MQLTVAIYRQSGEQFLQVEVGPDMTIADLKGIIEADSSIPSAQIDVFVRSSVVTDNSQTISASGLSDGDIIEVRVRKAASAAARQPNQQTSSSSLSSSQQQRQGSGGGAAGSAGVESQIRETAERLRLQALNDPRLMEQLRQQAPEMAEAAQDSGRFVEQYRTMVNKQRAAEEERARMLARLDDDPFDVEAQRKIEEIIREQAVMRNYEDAVENLPESFAHVSMLYIPVEVNGTPVKAFVDSGAQTTIMSPSCAERCGILRLLDKRFAGIARGVGTAKILGRVHSAQLRVGSKHLACSFTVMEGKDVDLLFGLDMLKRHQGIIDLRDNALHIQGETVHFLPENEIPKKDFAADEPLVEGPAGLKTGARSGTVVPPEQQRQPASGAATASSSSQAPTTPAPAPAPAAASAPTSSQFPAAHIEQLIALGFSREEAINALQATGGNLDQAAAMLFG